MSIEPRRAAQIRPGVIVAGAVLLAVAAGMLFDGGEALDINPKRLIGPFVMIAIGTIVVLGSKGCTGHEDETTRERLRQSDQGRWIGGMWLIGTGCWLLISHTHVFGLTFRTSWPLLLILVGTLTAIRGWR